MKRCALVLAVLMMFTLLLPFGAGAELKKGDRGEDVRMMQQMLTELGFLNDKVDGIFGKKTQAAVKALQEYGGLTVTGKYDDDTQFKLYDLYALAFGMMEGDGLGEDELREIYPLYCSRNEDDEWGVEYCYRHLEEMYVMKQLAEPEPPAILEKLLFERLISLWVNDIELMYDDWEENAPEEEQQIAQEQKENFFAVLEENREAWQRDHTPEEALAHEAAWLENMGLDLCMDLYGMEKN